jgi:hypothetical protein
MPDSETCIATSLLARDNHALLLIDYEYLQLITTRSHDPEGVLAAALFLAKGGFKDPSLSRRDKELSAKCRQYSLVSRSGSQ